MSSLVGWMTGAVRRVLGWPSQPAPSATSTRVRTPDRVSTIERAPVLEWPAPEQLSPAQITELCARGRFHALFVQKGTPTLNTVARVYDAFLTRFRPRADILRAIKQAHEVLNVPLYREQWERSRKAMGHVEAAIGARAFATKEAAIWASLWKDVEARFHLKPELMTDRVVEDLARMHTARHR